MTTAELKECLSNAQIESNIAKNEPCSPAENRLIDAVDDLIAVLSELLERQHQIEELARQVRLLYATLQRMPRLEGFDDSLFLASLKLGIEPLKPDEVTSGSNRRTK